MPVEYLTYAALGDRLNISSAAARSLARRLRLPRSLSDDGRALVSIDLAEVRHTPHPPSHRQAGNIALLAAQIEALQVENARLETSAAGHRADFERERSDRLIGELRQAAAETTAAKAATARLEGELAALRAGTRTVAPTDSQGPRRLGSLAATLVEADRKAAARG
jgi:hypothetical protein